MMSRTFIKNLIVGLLLAICSHSLRAQNVESRSIYYRFDSAVIDTTFRDNRFNTMRLIDLITRPGVMIDSVDIYGYASPDGGHRRNGILSKERAISARDFLLQHSPDSLVLNSTRIRIHAMQENWEGLQKAVEDGYFYMNRNELLRIIYKKGLGVCTRENKIKGLDRGYTWHLLKKEFMPDLRTATIITLYTTTYPDFKEYRRAQMMAPELGLIKEQVAQQEVEKEQLKEKEKVKEKVKDQQQDTKNDEKGQKLLKEEKIQEVDNELLKTKEQEKDQQQEKDKVQQQEKEKVQQQDTKNNEKSQEQPNGNEELQNLTTDSESRKVFMAFKTNMLYDMAMTPNIGVEFHLGKNWSLGANWGYAWWKHDPKAFYWRTYGGEVDLRKYFGKQAKKRPLSGHHLGIYAQGVTYDFCLGHTGILSDLSYGGGLEYGYSVPVARSLNIDFGIGVGYLGGEYKVYDPIDDHYVWRETRQRHWFGPTKAEISLVWLIGNKAFRKGGAK